MEHMKWVVTVGRNKLYWPTEGIRESGGGAEGKKEYGWEN